jgi:beta-glucosidase
LHLGVAPAFPFGFGLSYTTFEVDEVSVRQDAGVLRVTGELRNTGARAGADVVQVYAELPDAEAPTRLVGWCRLDVAAGAAAPFEVVVPLDRLATRNTAQKGWHAASGSHRITVGRFAGDPAGITASIHI